MVIPEANHPVEQFHTASPQPIAGETILLLEDEDSLRTLFQEVLEADGYTVVAAATCVEAGALFEQHQAAIRLVVADCLVPGGNARSTVEGFRSRAPDLPVLYMSGLPPGSALQNGEPPSRFRFLGKPFTFSALRSAVRGALDDE